MRCGLIETALIGVARSTSQGVAAAALGTTTSTRLQMKPPIPGYLNIQEFSPKGHLLMNLGRYVIDHTGFSP